MTISGITGRKYSGQRTTFVDDGLHVNQVQMTPETPLLKRITKQNVGGAGIFGVACTTKSEEKLPERSATSDKKNYSADETRSNLS